MRNLKRALSLALASVMLMGMMVVGSSAASFPDVSSEDNTEAIAVLEAVKVMIGNEKGEFEPNKNVTRNEMAVIMAKLILGTYEADSYVGSHPFTDVPDWASKYVAACYNAGIIAGRGEGIYDGQSTVTAVEAAAMMLRALGYEDLSVGAAQWDQPVAAKANEINLFDGLSGNSQTPMDRNTVAKLALNTLQATMVTTVRDGQDITLPDGTTIVSARNYNERTTNVYNYTQADGKYVANEDNKLQLCEFLYGRDLVLTSGTDGLGRTTDLWQYKGDDVVEIAKEAWKTMVINPDDDTTISGVLTSDDYFDLGASSISASVSYKLNGDTKTASEALKAGDVVELFRADNKVSLVVVTRYTLAQVSKVDDDVSSADAKDGASYYVSLKALGGSSKGTYNDNDFAGFNAAEYTEDIFVAIAQNGESEIVASHVAKAIEGKVTAYKAPKTVTLDGTKYSLANPLDAASTTNFDFDDSQYVLYMTENDYVLGIDGTEAVKLDDVYYVHSAYNTKSGNGNQNFYAQVVDMDGVESEIQIEKTTYVDTFQISGSTEANTFAAVQKLFTFSDKDAATTGNANYGGQTASVDAKSNNGKFSAKAYTGNDDYKVASNGGALTTLTADIKSDSKSVAVNHAFTGAVKSAYIDSDTKFVLIDNDGSNADLDISTSTGSAKVATTKKAFVIASRDGSSYVANVVIVVDTGVSDGVSSDEVLYLTETSTTKVKNGYEATAYFMDGTSKTVTIDAAGDKGFWTYSVNNDDVYELGSTPSNALINGSNYDKETGVIAATTISSIYRSRLITFAGASTQNGKLNDIALNADLQVVDVRSDRAHTAYTQKITDLSKLEAAMEKDGVTATAYVDDGEVVFISVTAMADTRDAVNTIASATAEQTAGDSGLTVTCTVEDATIRVAVTAGSPVDGDKITVTPTLTSNKATSTGAVVLTYTGATWNTGEITVTAENGDTKDYTVTTAPAPALSSDTTVASAKAAKAANAGAGLIVTENAAVTNGPDNFTIKVTVSGTATNGDKITVTATPNDGGAAVSGTAELTYDTDHWTTGTITVTAENGTASQAYTVSVALPAGTDPTITAVAPKGLKSGAQAENTVTATVENKSDITNAGGELTYVWQDVTNAQKPVDLTAVDASTPETVNVASLSVGVHELKCTVTNTQEGKADASATLTCTVVVFPADWDAVVTDDWANLTTAASSATNSGFKIVDTLDTTTFVPTAAGDGTVLDSSASIDGTTKDIKVVVSKTGDGKITVTLTYSYGSGQSAGTLAQDYESGNLNVAS